MNVAIILNYNDYDNCLSIINKIKGYSAFDLIVVVDNCSSDNSYSKLLSFVSEKIHVIKSDKNGGYGYGNNFAIRYVESLFSNITTITIMNPDVLIDEDVVYEMFKYLFTESDIALVSPRMILPGGVVFSRQHWEVPTKKTFLNELTYFQKKIRPEKNGIHFEDENILEVGVISGPCICFKYDVLKATNLYDESMFLYWEESYIGLKLQKLGYKSIILKKFEYLHNHSESIKKSVGSELRRMRFFYDSRKVFFNNNFHSTFIEKIVFLVLSKINELEFLILNLVRKTNAD